MARYGRSYASELRPQFRGGETASERLVAEMKINRQNEADSVKGEWAAISLYPGGTHGISSNPITYGKAHQIVNEKRVVDQFSPIRKIVKWRETLSEEFEKVKSVRDFVNFE